MALDISDAAALTEAPKGRAAVISSAHSLDNNPDQLIASVKAAGVGRYVVVSVAASLEVAPGLQLIDSPRTSPPNMSWNRAPALFSSRSWAERRISNGPSCRRPSTSGRANARAVPSRHDQLLSTSEGSNISFEDFAVAMADEIETPKHGRAWFAVGY